VTLVVVRVCAPPRATDDHRLACAMGNALPAVIRHARRRPMRCAVKANAHIDKQRNDSSWHRAQAKLKVRLAPKLPAAASFALAHAVDFVAYVGLDDPVGAGSRRVGSGERAFKHDGLDAMSPCRRPAGISCATRCA
jgi:hypothetical protein